jgi:hypothetical protein
MLLPNTLASSRIAVRICAVLLCLSALTACDSDDSDDSESLTPGQVDGVVREPSGKVVRGATVRVEETGLELLTNRQGEFSFPYPEGLGVCLSVQAGAVSAALCAEPVEGEGLSVQVQMPADPGRPFTCEKDDSECQNSSLPAPDRTACTTDSECGFGKTCYFQTGSCGQGGDLGQCFAPPQECEDVFTPACGCNGQTYNNECEALSEGVSILRSGFC